MTKSQTGSLFIVHCSLLIAFVLRLYCLDGQSIWVDEGISLHLATSNLAEIVANRAANVHPPLYFFLLKGWVALAGVSIFSARFLSAMASLLQVAAIYTVARRWLGRPTAWVAAFLTAISPPSVVYAQEVRAYALLPLVYLALLAITHELTQKPGPHPRATWLLLGIVETVGLHLHYTVLTIVAYIGVWSFLTLWKEKRRTDLRRWWITQLLVGIASLPWMITVIAHWPAVQAEAQAGTFLAQSPPLDYLLAQAWIFPLTGLAGAVGHPAIRLLAVLALLLLATLLLLRLRQPSTRRTVARLAAHWLIPLGFAFLVWIVRPFSHPRYIALYAPGLTLLAAYAIYPGKFQISSLESQIPRAAICHLSFVIPAMLAITLVLISLLGLRAYFSDPAFAKDNVRGVAHYLEEAAGPDDLILIPDGDWSLTFAYQGTASIEMPGMPDEQKMWANLTRWTAQRQRVFVMNYPQGISKDPQEAVPFALEKEGSLFMRQSFNDIFLSLYNLDRPVKPPTLDPVGACFGILTLSQSWIEAEAPADTALTLALRWHLKEDTDHRHGLTIRLLDVDGWPLATHDVLLLDGQNRPTDYWPADQEATTYHVMSIPPGVPPLTYTLTVGLYQQAEDGPRPLDLLDEQGAPQGQWLDLATVRLTEPLGITGDPYRTADGPSPLPQPVDLADGLRLLGASLDRSALRSGQSLFAILRWQATRSHLPDLRPRLVLMQADRELTAVASAPALGRYPTDRWKAGETVIEHRRLVVPPAAATGPADVVLTLGDRRLVLGQVEIITGEHIFTPPPIAYPLSTRFGQIARLIGYDLPSQALTAGEPITLTLYWEALEGAAGSDYTVFTHILDANDHLVGQHDGPPASGARPTAGWVAGEIITDQHVMAFRESYAGPARIEVGLYDAATLERVQAEGGEVFVLLPTALTILER